MKYLFIASVGMVTSVFAADNFKEDNVVRNDYKVINGQVTAVDNIATLPVEQHYNKACVAFNKKDWPEAARQFYIVSFNFPKTSYGHDAIFYDGIANYHMDEFDIANRKFTQYLKCQNNPKYFLETMEYKLAIAEQFRTGAKKHVFGMEYLPKWGTGRSLALSIYDELIAAMPNHELAAQALFSKASLLWDLQQYDDAIESYQTLIRRFPKHEYAPECYLFINKIYIAIAQKEFQNSDYLAHAKINLKRFKEDFPGEERLDEAEQDVLAIKEIYAKGLYDTGLFYEKIQYPKAAAIYYRKALSEFPETDVATCCKDRLQGI